jgi:hypothetical protein
MRIPSRPTAADWSVRALARALVHASLQSWIRFRSATVATLRQLGAGRTEDEGRASAAPVQNNDKAAVAARKLFMPMP